MKVLVVSAFPPDPAPEANHALHISEQLADAGLEVDVLCQKGSVTAAHPGVSVVPLMDDWSWSDVPQLEAGLRESRPDVVLLLYIGWVFHHHPMITYLPTFCERVLPGVPCVTQFENVDEGAPHRSLLEHARRRWMAFRAGGADVHWLFGTLLRDSARIIALSSPHRDRLVKADPDVDEKCLILPPPPLIRICSEPAAAARERAREAIGAEPDDFVWMYWGYIYPGKGLETLFHAFRMAQRRVPRLRVAVVGGSLDFPTGPISCADYFTMVRDLPGRLGISDRVAWTGPFDWDSEEGSRYLHAADGCVLPFDFGVTLNNSSLAAATTHGLPVIGTTLWEGRDEILDHGRNVYLTRPQDPEALAEAMELIAEDERLRARLRDGARGLAADWHSWDSLTERLVGVLSSAAEDEPGAVDGDSRQDADVGVAREATQAAQAAQAAQGAEGTVPPVSVVVAAYNVEEYLSQCLDALVHQTLPGVEVIVVNDASTDASADIVERYRSRYRNVRAVHCERNVGLASVRNIGMSVATGEYVAFADGDDWVDVRMCEVFYDRAKADDADVVIGDTTVFYDDLKTFTPFFDQQVRRVLSPSLRSFPFPVEVDPRVLLLEPVAWTKAYRRSFLEAHGIRFEDGMNSYEDICFHFWVLVTAKRISLSDEPLSFYRQNRPGQISGRTSRKVFEVFEVFRRIHEKLTALDVSDETWAMLLKVQIRQFDWLLRDRVRSSHRSEFMALVKEQLRLIPKAAFTRLRRHANRDEAAKLFFLRRGWLFGYERVASHRWPVFPMADVELGERRGGIVRGGWERAVSRVRRGSVAVLRLAMSKVLAGPKEAGKGRSTEDRMNELMNTVAASSAEQQLLLEVHRIRDEVLFLSGPSERSGLTDAVWRANSDHYLTRSAVFRKGDTLVDVGAHVGVLSLYLAKRYPFLTVYAVEPDPLNYRYLERNIEANGLGNVVPINKAVAGRRGEAVLHVDARNSSWATIESGLAASRQVLRTAQVETLTLDQLFQDHGIRHCRVLKVTALGVVQESLRDFGRRGDVDLLCGEADLGDCGRGRLEMLSWRIARQFFWRTVTRSGEQPVHSWIHHIPSGIDGDDHRESQRYPVSPALHSAEREVKISSRMSSTSRVSPQPG